MDVCDGVQAAVLPALPLIVPDDRFPESVVRMANEASSVLWTDPSSAANRVRSAVEELLTLQKVPRTVTKNGKRTRLSLDARIAKFKAARSKHAEASDLLKAIKWIGNDGSHGRALTAPQVIEAAELLEHALKQIYDKRDLRAHDQRHAGGRAGGRSQDRAAPTAVVRRLASAATASRSSSHPPHRWEALPPSRHTEGTRAPTMAPIQRSSSREQ